MQQQKSVSSGLKWVWRLLSSTISVVGFFFLNRHSIIEAYSDWIIVLCFMALITCLFFLEKGKRGIETTESEWVKDIALSAFILLLLTLICKYVGFRKEEDYADKELLSDVTMFMADEYPSMVENPDNHGWLPEAMKNGQVVFLLVPPDMDLENEEDMASILRGIVSEDSNEDPQMLRAFMMSVTENNTKVTSKYNLLVLSGPKLDEQCNLDKNVGTILPGRSISSVLDGIMEMNQGHWDSARRFFEEADSLGNAAGTYQLAYWYERGFGREPDVPKSERIYRKAAENGSREARVELGRRYLLDSSSTQLQKVEGERYLHNAALVSTVATKKSISYSERALDGLNDYLRAVKRFKEAYELTKDSYEQLNNPYFRYVTHLDNCISLKKYNEAMEIIKEGKSQGVGYCYLIHAGLLTNGKGLKKDYSEAEKLLRYAADSLDYYPAYRGLADLYRITNREGVEFWESLYEVRFSNTVE